MRNYVVAYLNLLTLCSGLIVASESAFAGNVENKNTIITEVFKASVVKVNVKFGKSIRDDKDVEQCASQGTGFIVNTRYIVTATHVFNFNEECGLPEIFIKSPYYENEWHVAFIDKQEDVALLKVDADAEMIPKNPPKTGFIPCSIDVSSENVYNIPEDQADRYGIPAELKFPKIVAVKIGSRDGDFSPLTELLPTPLNFGESGGPVIAGARVVGIVREKFVHADMIGLMTPAKEIYDLLKRNNALFSDNEECRISRFIEAETTKIDGTTVFGEAKIVGPIFSNIEASDRDIIKQTVVQSFQNENIAKSDIQFFDIEKGIEYKVDIAGKNISPDIGAKVTNDFAVNINNNFSNMLKF